MNYIPNANPMAVMFSTRGGLDVDTKGNLAKKPYFPKEVEYLDTHEEIIKLVNELRFGEQVVVLVEGKDGIPEELKAWFEREATQGDGYYRYVILKSNGESGEFFGLNGEHAIFAMGPNLRFMGVQLKEDIPIGDQIPWVLANENPALVLAGWRKKIEKSNKIKSGIPWSYLRYLKENRNFTINDVLDEVSTLLDNEDETKRLKGIRLAKIFLQANNINANKFFDLLQKISSPIIKGKKEASVEVFAELIETLKLICSRKARSEEKELISAGIKLYGDIFTNATKKMDNVLRYRLENEPIEKRAEIIELMTKARIPLPYSKFIEYLLITDNPKIRRAAAEHFALQIVTEHYFIRAEHYTQIIDLFRRESDPEIKAYLLIGLADSSEYIPMLMIEDDVSEILGSSDTPEIVRNAAPKYQDTLNKFKSEYDRQKEKFNFGFKWRGAEELTVADLDNSLTGGFFLMGGVSYDLGFVIGNVAETTWAIKTGVESDLRLGAHWSHGWTSIMPSIALNVSLERHALEFNYNPWVRSRGKNKNPVYKGGYGVGLSGGVVGRYAPVQDYRGFRQGILESLSIYLIEGEGSPMMGRIGGRITHMYFPEQEGFYPAHLFIGGAFIEF